MGDGKIAALLLVYSLWWLAASFSAQCRAEEEGWARPESGHGDHRGAAAEGGPQELFERWIAKHRKFYASPEEKAGRYANFLSNLEFVRRRSAEPPPGSPAGRHAVGLNVFADMSNEEFKRVYSSRSLKKKAAEERRAGKRFAEAAADGSGAATTCDAPASLDWRKKGAVTGVKNQGQCGSCWAFSSTGAMEGINAIAAGELVSLSEQELVDCDATNDGCDGGYMDYAFEWVIDNGGIDGEADYPYTGHDGKCNATAETRQVVSIDGYKDVRPSGGALLCAVVQQPVSVAISASAADFQLYTGGIYDGDCSSNPEDIDHAVLVVGYGRQHGGGGADYWIVKNSWGTDWGMRGYIYIRRNTALPYGVCAIDAMASYPTKRSAPATPPAPSLPPPPPPFSPPSPSPSDCGDFSYCPPDETCCCLLELSPTCLIHGCCGYEDAVCCVGGSYCCPHDYPVCDVVDGLCLQRRGDAMGVGAKKRKMAKHKLPWTKKLAGGPGGAAQLRQPPWLWRRGGGIAAAER